MMWRGAMGDGDRSLRRDFVLPPSMLFMDPAIPRYSMTLRLKTPVRLEFLKVPG